VQGESFDWTNLLRQLGNADSLQNPATRAEAIILARKAFSRNARMHVVASSTRIGAHPVLRASSEHHNQHKLRVILKERGPTCGRVFAEGLGDFLTNSWETMMLMPEFTPDVRILLFATPDVCLRRLKVRGRANETYDCAQYMEWSRLHAHWEPDFTIVIDANAPKHQVLAMTFGAILSGVTKRILSLGQKCPPVLTHVQRALRHHIYNNSHPDAPVSGSSADRRHRRAGVTWVWVGNNNGHNIAAQYTHPPSLRCPTICLAEPLRPTQQQADSEPCPKGNL
jgi:hypothetical protein